MKLPEKYRFKTWLGELGGNTLTMTLVLAFASFLNNASFLSLVAIFGTSLFYSLTARKNPLRSGVLPSLIASSILQFGYFVSGAEMYPETVSVGLFLANFIIILVVALVPSAIGAFIRNRKIKKDTKEREELERKTSQFSDNLRRLAMLVLFFYVQMFVVVPMAAKVSAATVTADEFIKNYDPDTTYTTKAKSVDTTPKRRMPIESPYANVSGNELEQLEAYCQSHGCSLTEVGSQLSIARITGTVSMDAYIGQLNQIYAPPPPPPRQSQWVLQEVGQWVVDGVTGKNAKGAKDKKGAKSKAKVAAKPDNRAWWQKGISWAQQTNKNIHHARDEFVNRMFNEPITAAWNYAKANPWKAAGIAAGAVLLTAAAIVSAPVAIAVGAVAVVGSLVYAGALGMAVYQHGWNGARDMVFSKETQRMAVTDPFGAFGRGTAEVAIAGFNLLPLAGATLKAPAAVTKMVQFAGGGAKSAETIKTAIATVPKFVNYVKELPTLRTVVNDAVNTGILRPQAVAVMKNMIKQAGTKLDDFPAVSNYVKGIFNASGPYVTNQLNTVGGGIASNTTKVYSEIELVQQGAKGIIAKEKVNFTPITQDKFRELNLPKSAYKKVQFTNASYGLKADTSNFEEGALQHFIQGEMNKNGNVVGAHMKPSSSSPAQIVAGTETAKDANGVYQAQVELYGYTKKKFGGQSTIFPDDWTPERTVNEINSAFKVKKWDPKINMYYGKSDSGVIIDMHIDPSSGKITSPRARFK